MLDAKEYLKQIKKDNDKIQNKLVELTQLKILASSTSSFSTGDRVQSSLEGDKLGKIIAKIVDAEKELDEMIDNLIAEEQKRIGIIEQVQKTSNIQYIILHKHYVQFKSFAEIAAEEHYSTARISQLHIKALGTVQKILNNLTDFNEFNH